MVVNPSTENMNVGDGGNPSEEPSGSLGDEYIGLLNRLEIPLISVPTQTTGLPILVNLYQNITIPISPDDVPIKLFDDHLVNSQNPHDDQSQETFHNTSDLLLPLLSEGHGHSPKNHLMLVGIVILIFLEHPLAYLILKRNLKVVIFIVMEIVVHLSVWHVISLIMRMLPISGRNIASCV